MAFARFVLALIGLMFLALGGWGLVAPAHLAGITGILLSNAMAVTDARAFYGGLEIGLGLFLLLGAARPAFARPGLWLIALTLGGAALARCVGLMIDQSGNTTLYGVLAVEASCAVLAAVALTRASSVD